MVLNARSLLVLLSSILVYTFYDLYFKLEYSPVIQTSSGKVRGVVSKSRLGNSFYQFTGIRYAEAPVQNLRFSSPRPVKPWSGILDATQFGPKCVQVDGLSRTVTGSEDCLFLNIFSPEKAISNGNNLLPVIFYIHGGYFMVGSSSYMGPEFFMDEPIILVTLNYRLNVFGFLSTGDSASKGNFGLIDQNLALRWINENIKYFGGDPSRITLAGQSAGSVAVHLHMLSSMSNGLFSGVIMSSGTAIKPLSLVNDPKAQAKNLARQLNCPTEKSSDLVECLRNIEPNTIINAQLHALSSPIMNELEIFAPSIETNCIMPAGEECFLSAHPYDILKNGGSARVPILTGVNKDEGLLSTARIFVNASLQEFVSTNWNDLSPNFFRYDKSAKNLTDKIRKFYIGDDSPSQQRLAFKENFQHITNIFSDRLYIHATRETVKIQSKFSKIYLYYFTYPLQRGMTYLFDIDPDLPILLQFIWKEIRWFLNEHIFQVPNLFLGCGHGDDIALLFKFPVFHLSPDSKDFAMSRQLVKLWADFATNHHALTFDGNSWPPVEKDAKNLKYMFIGNGENHGSLVDEPFAQRMVFWDNINLPWKIR